MILARAHSAAVRKRQESAPNQRISLGATLDEYRSYGSIDFLDTTGFHEGVAGTRHFFYIFSW